MKALTFNELWSVITDDKFKDLEGPVSQFEKLFNLIRQGTLLEEEAIRIPQEKDWPKGAKCISVIFSCDSYDSVEEGFMGFVCKDIPRPQPVWLPKKDDPVFVLQNGYLCVGMIYGIPKDGVTVQIGNEIRDYPIHLVKPFSLEKITSAWEDI